MRQFRWIGLSIAAAVVVVILAALAVTPIISAKGGHGKHKIQWSPERVVSVVKPGETAQVTVSFSSTVDLTNASFRLTDSFSDTVSVSPTSFPSIVAGTEYQVEITFVAPAEGHRKRFHGAMITVDDTKAYAKPLKLRFGVEKEKKQK